MIDRSIQEYILMYLQNETAPETGIVDIIKMLYIYIYMYNIIWLTIIYKREK
jgi:hypothetical protein